MKKFLKSLLAVMLIAIMALSLTSCGVPSDPAKAKENLTKNEFTVDETAGALAVGVYVTAAYGLSASKNIGKVILASKDSDSVLIVYSEDAELLEKLHKDLEALYAEVVKDDEEVDLEKGKSGDCVWVGTSAGVKAAC